MEWTSIHFQGKIETQGDYNDILQSGIDLTTLLNKNEDANKEETNKCDDLAIEKTLVTSVPVNNETNASGEKQNESKEEIQPLKNLESSSRGQIKGSLLWNYFKAAKKPFTLAFLLASFILAQVLASVSDVWVSYW